ncbi:GNAT family N-acetyltransferase [Arhodomonas sp. AD133]|uniref:GNAT family N-acetyltransferase n=1 Tax=Arhodomonas sp. AD133 TaxID=3415009 RepID=UPI003EBE6F44
MLANDMPTPSLDWRAATSMRSHADNTAYDVRQVGKTLAVTNPATGDESTWKMSGSAGDLTVEWGGGAVNAPSGSELLAVFEAAFTFNPELDRIMVTLPDGDYTALFSNGVLVPDSDGTAIVHKDILWQQPRLWLPRVDEPFPLQYRLSDGRRHPRRAPKPEGLLYRRYIPWLGRTFSFRSVDVDRDLDLIHDWMNDPVVARFFQEDGSLDEHRRYLERTEKDPHIYSMIASLGDRPFGYFEVYWAKENRVAPYYDAHDYDRGWHVLIGDSEMRGKAYATAWLTSISHYLFLDEPRTQRIVGEPDVGHTQQIRNLDRSGYAKIKAFDFPHKRAMLVMMLRERFFSDALWWPCG